MFMLFDNLRSLQAGPLEKVRIPKDRDGRQKNFAFITYCHEVSVPYAINLFRGTALYHKTLSLQSRGRMALLPPPIRCVGPEPTIDFQGQNMAQQFIEMTDRLTGDDYKMVQMPRGQQAASDKLVLASLQGNWSHRHHPYRPKEQNQREDYRSRDRRNDHKDSGRGKHNSYRRNTGKGNYHRRD